MRLIATGIAEYRRRRFGILFCLLVLVLVLPVAIDYSGVPTVSIEWLVAFSLTAHALGHDVRSHRVRDLILVAIAVICRMVDDNYAAHTVAATLSTMIIGALVISATYEALRFALRGRSVTSEQILAALCVYLLAGQFYASLYWEVEALLPGSFHEQGRPHLPGQFDLRTATYLSYVTISTTGFGDITPVTYGTRSIVISEAIFGQLYLAVLVARLTGASQQDESR